jgi:hypothetical protein
MLMPIPDRKPPTAKPSASTPREHPRRHYSKLEAGRAELIARLHALDEKAQKHPSYKRALKLLNETFRKSKLTQRLAVLQAASWVIDVLEQVTMLL